MLIVMGWVSTSGSWINANEQSLDLSVMRPILQSSITLQRQVIGGSISDLSRHYQDYRMNFRRRDELRSFAAAREAHQLAAVVSGTQIPSAG